MDKSTLQLERYVRELKRERDPNPNTMHNAWVNGGGIHNWVRTQQINN